MSLGADCIIAALPSPAELVADFWARLQAKGEVDRDAVRALAASAIGERTAVDMAVRALFREVVQTATAGLAPDDWLVIDTDSRITQTNLLPLAPDERTRYFP